MTASVMSFSLMFFCGKDDPCECLDKSVESTSTLMMFGEWEFPLFSVCNRPIGSRFAWNHKERSIRKFDPFVCIDSLIRLLTKRSRGSGGRAMFSVIIALIKHCAVNGMASSCMRPPGPGRHTDWPYGSRACSSLSRSKFR